jgi:hypothetical protein
MTTIYPAGQCEPAVHIPPPTAKTVRELRLEAMLAEALPYLLVIEQPGDKLIDLIDRIVGETA